MTHVIEDEAMGGPAVAERISAHVIVLASRRTGPALHDVAARSGTCLPGPVYQFGLQFSTTDHAALAAWAADPSHGYDRLHVERGVPGDVARASYALVYMPGFSWSTWGITRRDGRVEVWRCSSGETVGRHARMADALASLPHAAEHRRATPVPADRSGIRHRVHRQGSR